MPHTAASVERGIQADTHAERFLGRKIARAHRAVHFRVPCRVARSLARSLVRSPVCMSAPMHALQHQRRLQSDRLGVPGRFFALKTSQLSRPSLAERGVTGCSFFHRPSVALFSSSSSSRAQLSSSFPFDSLFSQLCLFVNAHIHAYMC